MLPTFLIKEILKKRWDRVKDFPDLPNFPHHIHIGSESNVEPGQSRSILEFIDFMESDF
ncbi:toxin-antitoxin system TumE family protein [Roseofilum halophilum]|uniref:toxin-antitoxin system TumE family protein n=1 Tax=Roseofilum halophilum TaxID=3082942 RepID=UPI00321BDC28